MMKESILQEDITMFNVYEPMSNVKTVEMWKFCYLSKYFEYKYGLSIFFFKKCNHLTDNFSFSFGFLNSVFYKLTQHENLNGQQWQQNTRALDF